MSKTAKFGVSMPEAEFKGIEAERRRTKKTRSGFIREAVRAHYELLKAAPETLADAAELRRRAIAAAGSFRSGTSDLSTNHDKYLEEHDSVTGAADAGDAKKKAGAKP